MSHGEKSKEALQKEVDAFNKNYKPGDRCVILLDGGEKMGVTVKAEASILGGHSAVGWFKEIRGCYSLGRVMK